MSTNSAIPLVWWHWRPNIINYHKSIPTLFFCFSQFSLHLAIIASFEWIGKLKAGEKLLIKSDIFGFFSNKNATYSLSKNYQLKENLLSMRLILPLDAAFVLLFCVYVVTGFFLRLYKDKISPLHYISYYYIAQMVWI